MLLNSPAKMSILRMVVAVPTPSRHHLSFSVNLTSANPQLFLRLKPSYVSRQLNPVKGPIRMSGQSRINPRDVSRRKRRQMKGQKVKQLFEAGLSRERQIYEMRKCTELKAAVPELERLWEPRQKAAKLFSVDVDDQSEFLVDQFQRPGSFDVRTERDEPKLFRTVDGVPSAKFSPKGVIHWVEPNGRIADDRVSKMDHSAGGSDSGSESENDAEELEEDTYSSRRMKGGRSKSDYPISEVAKVRGRNGYGRTERDGPELFRTIDVLPSAKFSPKGIVHRVKPNGRIADYRCSKMDHSAGSLDSGSESENDAEESQEDIYSSRRMKGGRGRLDYPVGSSIYEGESDGELAKVRGRNGYGSNRRISNRKVTGDVNNFGRKKISSESGGVGGWSNGRMIKMMNLKKFGEALESDSSRRNFGLSQIAFDRKQRGKTGIRRRRGKNSTGRTNRKRGLRYSNSDDYDTNRRISNRYVTSGVNSSGRKKVSLESGGVGGWSNGRVIEKMNRKKFGEASELGSSRRNFGFSQFGFDRKPRGEIGIRRRGDNSTGRINRMQGSRYSNTDFYDTSLEEDGSYGFQALSGDCNLE